MGPPPSFPLRDPFANGGIRFKSNKGQMNKTSKKKAKEVRLKLRQLRMASQARKAKMSPEETLVWRIEKLKRKKAVHEERLKKYELPEFPEADPDPESLTPEQLYALKKLGYKNKNYVPVGRRGIYGGTIQNMHMHWKKHETVRICCDNFPKEKIKEMGEQLERLSGGVVIDIHQARTIIMYRGRNYKRPQNDIPEVFKKFNKRKALLKSKHLQAIGSLDDNICKWEKDLRVVRADMAREAADKARWAAQEPISPSLEPVRQPISPEEFVEWESDELTDTEDDFTETEDELPDTEDDFTETEDEFTDTEEDVSTDVEELVKETDSDKHHSAG